MGHGASLHGEEAVELTADDKALLAVELKAKFCDYSVKGKSEADIYELLSIDHATIVGKIIADKEKERMQPSDSVPPLGGSHVPAGMQEVLHRSASDEDRFSPHFKAAGPAAGPEADSPDELPRSLSNKELQSPQNEKAPRDIVVPGLLQPSRAPILDELPKSGEETPVNSFRKRRLTMADSKPVSPMDGVSFPKRASIFSSTEIGVAAESTAPFSNDILGTFSCHGIEPEYGDDDEEIGVIQKINQDRGCVVYPFNRSRAQALFMVMDGHGSEGNRVSEHVMRKIVPLLELERMSDPVACFKRACLQVDRELKDTDMKYKTSGTTLIAIYTMGQRYWVACVGDSRAVLARSVDNQLVAVDLSVDQKPSIAAERERILKSGGFVGDPDEDGLSSRVYLDEACTRVGLAVSRSIGDHVVKGVGVIAEPEVAEYTLEENDKFYILASDGVWEFISSQEAVDVVSKHISKGAEVACQILIERATAKWQEEEGDYRDDITAIVVVLPLPCQVALPLGLSVEMSPLGSGKIHGGNLTRMRRAASTHDF